MLFNLILILHIAGAMATVATIVYAGRELLSVRQNYIKHIKIVAVVGLWQLATGAVLVFSSAALNLGRSCLAGLAYLTVVSGTEALLVKRLRTANATK